MSKKFRWVPVKTVPRSVEIPKCVVVSWATPSIRVKIGSDEIYIDAGKIGWNREMDCSYNEDNYYTFYFYW